MATTQSPTGNKIWIYGGLPSKISTIDPQHDPDWFSFVDNSSTWTVTQPSWTTSINTTGATHGNIIATGGSYTTNPINHHHLMDSIDDVAKELLSINTETSYYLYSPSKFVASYEMGEKVFQDFSLHALYHHCYQPIVRKIGCNFQFISDRDVELRDIDDWLKSTNPNGYIGYNPFQRTIYCSSESTFILMNLKFS